jgi:hypothetical protein
VVALHPTNRPRMKIRLPNYGYGRSGRRRSSGRSQLAQPVEALPGPPQQLFDKTGGYVYFTGSVTVSGD